jgi:hypothetical protein
VGWRKVYMIYTLMKKRAALVSCTFINALTAALLTTGYPSLIEKKRCKGRAKIMLFI